MTFKNFKVETDADGIALVTWDIPGKSMNVLDTQTIEELSAIVDQTTADAGVKGVVVTSGKEAFSAGADLSMLEGMNKLFAETAKQFAGLVERGLRPLVGATFDLADGATALRMIEERAVAGKVVLTTR